MKKKLLKWVRLITASMVLCAMFSGCAWQLGGDKSGTTYVQTTRGQELIDLKKAKEQGAISDEEYQAQRQKVLNR